MRWMADARLLVVCLLAMAAVDAVAGCYDGSVIELSTEEATPVNAKLGTYSKTSNAPLTCVQPGSSIRVDDRGMEFDVVLAKAIGDEFDQGIASDFDVQLCICGTTPPFAVVEIVLSFTDSNNRRPVFSVGPEVNVTLDQSASPDLDLAYLIDGGQLRVYDDDRTEVDRLLTFSVDDDVLFRVLPAVESRRVKTDVNESFTIDANVQYPRLGLKQSLTDDVTVRLIATDNGTPPSSSSLTIHVAVKPSPPPQDPEIPAFNQIYYTADPVAADYVGPLTTDVPITAQLNDDPDAILSYTVLSAVGAEDAVDIAQANGSITLSLSNEVDWSSTEGGNMLIIIIEAHVDGHPNFYTTAVVAVAQKSGDPVFDNNVFRVQMASLDSIGILIPEPAIKAEDNADPSKLIHYSVVSSVGAEDAVAVLPKSDGGVNLVLGQPVAWDRTPGGSALIILVEARLDGHPERKATAVGVAPRPTEVYDPSFNADVFKADPITSEFTGLLTTPFAIKAIFQSDDTIPLEYSVLSSVGADGAVEIEDQSDGSIRINLIRAVDWDATPGGDSLIVIVQCQAQVPDMPELKAKAVVVVRKDP